MHAAEKECALKEYVSSLLGYNKGRRDWKAGQWSGVMLKPADYTKLISGEFLVFWHL